MSASTTTTKRICSTCCVEKDLHTFGISNYGSKGQTLFKNVCKGCENNNRRVVRQLRRIHNKPMTGTMCEIQHCKNTNLCLDHDHKNGSFRGWICTTHNVAIGAMNDTTDGVLAVLNYLQACDRNDHISISPPAQKKIKF